MNRRIRVEVKPGLFPHERTASFEAGGRRYVLVVDDVDIENDTLLVRIVQEGDAEAIVDLPRETFTSGPRVKVPRELLLPA